MGSIMCLDASIYKCIGMNYLKYKLYEKCITKNFKISKENNAGRTFYNIV